MSLTMKYIEFFFLIFNPCSYIMPNHKIGHIDGIEQNVEVYMQYFYYIINKSIDNETQK